ncbi:MAG: SRPBCC family protein [Bacteroidetes bacterium]|nr:SRPBCC family protein [Bacteroidota bacterium]
MTIYTVESAVTIAAPIEAVFDFHLDVANLNKISPPGMSARLVKDEGLGTARTMYLEITQFGLFKSHWIVKIDEFDPPFKLTDLVVKGPFPYFRHSRTFSQPCAALTELRDKLEYALPFGAIGRLANKISVQRMINDMFEHRHRITKELLEERFYIKEIPVS